MKKYFPLLILILTGLPVGMMNSCKKDTASTPYASTSFTEEFVDFYTVLQKGWIAVDNYQGDSVLSAAWGQGIVGSDKTGAWHGFTAFSYITTQGEFTYSYTTGSNTNYSINSWLITPILSVKNGDKISFYTRGDTTAGIFTDRMQVLLNPSTSVFTGFNIHSSGDFTRILFDINADQIQGGYPITWTKYEYTFSGFTQKTNVRVAFRHFVENTLNAGGIGIDLFHFQSN